MMLVNNAEVTLHCHILFHSTCYVLFLWVSVFFKFTWITNVFLDFRMVIYLYLNFYSIGYKFICCRYYGQFWLSYSWLVNFGTASFGWICQIVVRIWSWCKVNFFVILFFWTFIKFLPSIFYSSLYLEIEGGSGRVINIFALGSIDPGSNLV